jgi:spore germination cell wall hydrolase CwlJ-like protein
MAEALSLSRPLDGLRQLAQRLKAPAQRLRAPAQRLKAHALRLNERAAALARANPRETVGVGLLGLVTAAVIAVSPGPNGSNAPAAAPPAPPPLLIRNLAPAQALQVNAEIPVASGPNPAARPFPFKGNSAARGQALECLASAAYYEAGNQDADGERAVAQVVLNRVRHPAFPASVCAVVYEGSTRPTGCQFTFTCDGSLARRPDVEGWKRALEVARAALGGYVYAPVGLATHYHADYVVPYWASTLAKNAIVGAHIFYRWAGGWGQPAAFAKNYAGREPSAAALRTAALSVVHVAQDGAVAQAIANIPGAEVIKLEPSMRGDKRVAVRFNLAARKASDDATHEDYAKKFDASDTLKWSLSGNSVAADEKPLGKAPVAAPAVAGGAVAAVGQR